MLKGGTNKKIKNQPKVVLWHHGPGNCETIMFHSSGHRDIPVTLFMWDVRTSYLFFEGYGNLIYPLLAHGLLERSGIYNVVSNCEIIMHKTSKEFYTEKGVD